MASPGKKKKQTNQVYVEPKVLTRERILVIRKGKRVFEWRDIT